tara:strand:+ start:4416 stop:4793 length:378 start_codon:yes stop_codon:yes gene_type:complete
MIKRRIALIACVKEKQNESSKAKDMYVSETFKVWMNYAESWGANQIYILSGKYGLLELEEEIIPYDFNLNLIKSEERRIWAQEVIHQLDDKARLNEDQFLVLANAIYAEYLIPHLTHYSMPLKIY